MNLTNASTRSRAKRRVVATAAILSLAVLADAALAAPVPIVATTSTKLVSSLDGWQNPEVFSFSADGHEHQLSWSNSWSAEDIFAATNSVAAPIGTAMSSNKISPTIAYYLGADGHVHQTLKPSTWQDRDLTAQAVGAPPAAANSSLNVLLMADGSSRIYYITAATGHIQEIAVSAAGGTASTADVTASSGAPLPASGSAMTSFLNGSSGISEPRVYFLDANGHVNELEFGTSGWHFLDVTNAAGGLAAVSGSAMTGSPLGGNPRVWYFTADGHVQELAWGSGWHATDITNAAGNTPAVAGSALTSELSNGNPRIYYFSYDWHVRELAWGSGWHSGGDITAKAGGTAAAPGSSLASNYRSKGNVVWLFYVSPDNHVQELAYTGGWSHNDINAQR